MDGSQSVERGNNTLLPGKVYVFVAYRSKFFKNIMSIFYSSKIGNGFSHLFGDEPSVAQCSKYGV